MEVAAEPSESRLRAGAALVATRGSLRMTGRPHGLICGLLFALAPAPGLAAQEAAPGGELVLPLQREHVHGSTITELPNGDLLVAWFQGSGERWADDVRIMGARRRAGGGGWSEPFLLADVDGFPDINPVLFVDARERLWLLWYTVIANQWETSLLKYRISEDFLAAEGAPDWRWQADLHVKPGGSGERGIQPDDPFVRSVREQADAYAAAAEGVDPAAAEAWKERLLAGARGEDMVRAGRLYRPDGTYEEAQLGYPYFRRMGWQSRSRPFITETGRIIVPLYSDGFSFSLMAYSDDGGERWAFSNPLVGAGNIQPAIARAPGGDLVAYMRDNGPAPKRLHVSRSSDDGATWSAVRDSDLPNPGSAADIVTLASGAWVLIHNDTERGRHSLAVALSEDGGATWPWKRHLELDGAATPRTAEYPAIVQGRDGRLHATYSYVVPGEGRSVKYVSFDEQWIRGR